MKLSKCIAILVACLLMVLPQCLQAQKTSKGMLMFPNKVWIEKYQKDRLKFIVERANIKGDKVELLQEILLDFDKQQMERWTSMKALHTTMNKPTTQEKNYSEILSRFTALEDEIQGVRTTLVKKLKIHFSDEQACKIYLYLHSFNAKQLMRGARR